MLLKHNTETNSGLNIIFLKYAHGPACHTQHINSLCFPNIEESCVTSLQVSEQFAPTNLISHRHQTRETEVPLILYRSS